MKREGHRAVSAATAALVILVAGVSAAEARRGGKLSSSSSSKSTPTATAPTSRSGSTVVIVPVGSSKKPATEQANAAPPIQPAPIINPPRPILQASLPTASESEEQPKPKGFRADLPVMGLSAKRSEMPIPGFVNLN